MTPTQEVKSVLDELRWTRRLRRTRFDPSHDRVRGSNREKRGLPLYEKKIDLKNIIQQHTESFRFSDENNAELSMKQWEIFKFFCSLIKAKKFLRQIPGRSTQIAVTSCLERGEAEDRARSVASFGTLYTFTCYVVHLSSHPRRKPSKLASNFVALV